VLPNGFHRIRHYGLLANGNRSGNIAHARQLLALPARPQPRALPRPCPCCGSRMIIIETFARGCEPKYRPTAAGGNQDRHVKMPSPSIYTYSNARHSCRLSAGTAQARIAALHSIELNISEGSAW
jgi:hypothetical protein